MYILCGKITLFFLPTFSIFCFFSHYIYMQEILMYGFDKYILKILLLNKIKVLDFHIRA